ncbi:MAG: DNA (cytosine-5-)-methyltransferase [Balneolia bacterium]|nr:DNA (cytosine-5-)-methyltransferase [Balneolia bacterium]
MKFVDLFAGIGGFHVALEENHECVFACEKKEVLAQLYEENFNIKPWRDINDVRIDEIPSHDILCAGFPCQPFSKAGSQKGLEDEKNGTLFDKIVEILAYHKPRYFILENVRNLANHDNQNTWKYIKYRLESELGYDVDKRIYSPHNFGIPQHRERVFIIGAKQGLNGFMWPETTNEITKIVDILDKEPVDAKKLENEKEQVLEIWQRFLDMIDLTDDVPTFPIWSMEFGATYPFQEMTPLNVADEELKKFKGSFGVSLDGLSREDIFKNLPSYAITKSGEFPSWKKNFIRKNRSFYTKYKVQIDAFISDLKNLEKSSWQKFEWNIKGGERIIMNNIIQFRGSGVRVKKPDYFPSLVTVSTQIPIIGWEKRYLTPKEGARLQALNELKLPNNLGTCFGALGNAVNAKIVELIADELIDKNATQLNKPTSEGDEEPNKSISNQASVIE